jgi:hypothetical protein
MGCSVQSGESLTGKMMSYLFVLRDREEIFCTMSLGDVVQQRSHNVGNILEWVRRA